MKGYVIKSIATATPDNPNFSGEVHTYYLVKGGYVRDTDIALWHEDVYKSRKVAERIATKHLENYKYYKNLTYKYWNMEYEVTEVEAI